jgi:radical SAM family protein
MKIMLIHPPVDDPTIPYHSTAYLKGHLKANGFEDVTMRDINVEYANYTWEEGTIKSFYQEAEARLHRIGQADALDFREQERYYALLAVHRRDPLEIGKAVAAFRCRETFLDYETYVKSLDVLMHYQNFLAALCYPSENLGFMPMTRARYSTASISDLLNRDLGDKVGFTLARYFQDRIAHDPAFEAADLLGVSIVYDHQLFHALHFVRLLRDRWPEKKIVIGGTAVTQLYKYMKDKQRIRPFFSLCDAIVVGEGETAICEMAASDGAFEGRTFTNTITYSRSDDRLIFPTVRYENVASLGVPIYDHPWELYLSPERGINYSPTRGCYWNRCTFCDYGLNSDRPTSPWRERAIDQVVLDLHNAQSNYGIKYVYFAVDVMAPGYLERMSDAIMNAGLDIRWCAELRMEKIFSEERAKKMAKAGCVCVSFGMESGNQRILDLIDKGTKVAYMGATMKNFANAGIACQLMAFTDFPTETPAEKTATHEFIHNNSEYWSSGGLGTFLLTGTSIIAKRPERFGIKLIETQDVDIARAVAYQVDTETGSRRSLTEDADASFDATGGVFPRILGRPWAGGTDTLHTMIYYSAYGRNFFKEHPPEIPTEVRNFTDEDISGFSIAVNGTVIESICELEQILSNRKAYLEYVDQRLKVPAEPTLSSFLEWASSVDPIRPAAGEPTYWLATGKRCVKLEKIVYRILSIAAHNNKLTVDQVNRSIPEKLRGRLLAYFKDLEAKGLISFRCGDRLLRRPESEDHSIADRVRTVHAKPAWKMEMPHGTADASKEVMAAHGD